MTGQMGTVYLIHFERPYQHARHYAGWASDLTGRLRHHRQGNGSRLMAAVSAARIPWRVVRTWDADRNFERKLKQHSLTRFCPVCSEQPRTTREERGTRA
jgi:predicted GIY-YIG superfamily endonuclease